MLSMPLKYLSGEEIKAGDQVLYGGEPGQIEFVAEPGRPQPGWDIEQCRVGCMILAPAYGRVFLPEPDEGLDFVSRGELLSR
jgi:hypothetical protein